MLVIRGSKSVMDWSINLEEGMCDYTFTHLIRNSDAAAASSNTSESDVGDYYVTNTLTGTIHRGLYTAAMGLLEGYNLRPVLMRLLTAGYQIKIVGHSLGAGIAALITAELRITLISKHLELYTDPHRFSPSSGLKATPFDLEDTGTPRRGDAKAENNPEAPLSPGVTRMGISRPESGVRAPEYLLNTIAAVSAVIFSCPAFMTANLGDAFLQDRLLINTIYDKDIIPRFSFKTIELMAEELNDPDFCAHADLWTDQDKNDFAAYAVSMGKAADIHKAGVAAVAETATSEDGSFASPEMVDDAVAMHDGATDSAHSSIRASAPPQPAPEPSPDRAAAAASFADYASGTPVRPPAKPDKPTKPAKPQPSRAERGESNESCTSYCTADGLEGVENVDTPLTEGSTSAKMSGAGGAQDDVSNATVAHQAGSSSTLSTQATAPAASARFSPAVPATDAAAPAVAGSSAPTTLGNANRLGSFMQGVTAFQTLAATVIDKFQSANDNVGGEFTWKLWRLCCFYCPQHWCLRFAVVAPIVGQYTLTPALYGFSATPASAQTRANRPVNQPTTVPTAVAAPLPEDNPTVPGDGKGTTATATAKASTGSAKGTTASGKPPKPTAAPSPARAPAAETSGQGGASALEAVPATAPNKGKASRAHTVTPGPIVHLYKENDGTSRLCGSAVYIGLFVGRWL
jgi:hypothetical protein